VPQDADYLGLRGKVAVVTGGGGGIGRATSLALARCGVHLVIGDRDAEGAAQTAQEGRAHGVDAVGLVTDVRDAEQLDLLFHTAEKTHGGLDIAVAVPGGSNVRSFLSGSSRGWNSLIELNLIQVLHTVQRAGRAMSGRGGSIVVVGSVEGGRAAPGMAIYGAMKAALQSLTMTLAVELGPEGIRINCVAPDMIRVRSAVEAGWFAADENDPVEKVSDYVTVPLGRVGRPEEVADCISFLASDRASYVTGTTVTIDGGTMAASGWLRWPTGLSNRLPRDVSELLRAGQESDPAPDPTGGG
jgi:NAD(P)-dependent dehydrogenase (short-subunit alcohol dehydrogenase family)